MTFKIETQVRNGPDCSFGKYERDDGLKIVLSSFTRAERFYRHTKVSVWAVEDEAALNYLVDSQSDMLDALFLSYPDLWETLNDEIEECRAGLKAGAAKSSATAETGPAAPGNSLGIVF
jgi:hypothetical protein